MKGLTLSIFIILLSQRVWGGAASSVSSEELLVKVDAISSELEQNDHEQEILNMAYNRSRVVLKKLDSANKPGGLEDAQDDDILPLLEDIAFLLEAGGHSAKSLEHSDKHLSQILLKLQENRKVVNEIAILTINGADPINIGTIFFGSESNVQLTITNEGNGQAQILGETGMDYPFQFRDGEYPGRNATCGDVILPGENCTIVIQFQANEIGVFADEMLLQYFDGVENQVLSKGVTGQAI